jgi:HK97 family phage portal protein
MRVAAFLSGVKTLANDIAKMPLILREIKTVSGRQRTQPALDNPLYTILKDAPNAWQTSYQLRWFLASQLIMKGNCFCQKITDQTGTIIGLNPLDAWNMSPHWDMTQKIPQLLWRHTDGNGTVREFKQSDLWHVTNLNIEGNGVEGTAIIALAKEALSVLMAAEETAGRNFANGLGMGGFISFPPEVEITEPQAQNVVDTLKKNFSGSQNAGKFSVIPMGGKWEKMTFNAQESQLLESRKWNEQEVVRLLGGAPLLVKLGLGESSSTYASSSAFLDEYFNTSLLPLTTAIEQSITRDLIDRKSWGKLYVKHSADIILRGSPKERAETNQIRIQSFQMTPNEARAVEDMDSVEGGDFLTGGTGTPVIFNIETQEFFIPGQQPPEVELEDGTEPNPATEAGDEDEADTEGTGDGTSAPPSKAPVKVPVKPDKSKKRLELLASAAVERVERKAAKSDLDAKFLATVLMCSQGDAEQYCTTYKDMTLDEQHTKLVSMVMGETVCTPSI